MAQGMLDRLERIEGLVAAVAYTAVAGLLLGEIIAREFFYASIWGSQKMAVFAAIIAGFLGLTLATAANGHLRPQFTDNWWPNAWQAGVARFGDGRKQAADLPVLRRELVGCGLPVQQALVLRAQPRVLVIDGEKAVDV